MTKRGTVSGISIKRSSIETSLEYKVNDRSSFTNQAIYWICEKGKKASLPTTSRVSSISTISSFLLIARMMAQLAGFLRDLNFLKASTMSSGTWHVVHATAPAAAEDAISFFLNCGNFFIKNIETV